MSGAGTQIPDCVLLEELGRGDGGIVFRALRGSDPCLVKLPAAPESGPRSNKAAFLRDGLALARLGNTGLPRTLQANDANGTPYLVMEIVDASPLPELLETDWGAREFLALATAMAASLARLHREGFRCGTLATADVLMRPDNLDVYLLDRGQLARSTASASERARIAANQSMLNDMHLLGQLLAECLPTDQECAAGLTEQVQAATHIVERMEHGDTYELASLAHELAALSTPRQRPSSFPPPDPSPTPDAVVKAARDALHDLRRAWHTAAKRGGRVVQLVGASGSGKTHLLQQLAYEVNRSDILVLSVRCRETDWAPFAALKRMLVEHVRGVGALPAARANELTTQLRAAAGPSAPLLRLLSDELQDVFEDSGVSLNSRDARDKFIEGTAEFLRRYLTSCGPAILIVDDLQWLGGSSRRVLARTIQGLSGTGTLVLCARRGDPGSERAANQFFADAHVEEAAAIELGPLKRPETLRLVEAFLEGRGRPAERLVDQLLDLCDGTPLALEDLLHRALEQGLLRPRWGTWDLEQGAEDILQPTDHGEDSCARLRSLNEDLRDVLTAVAVAGEGAQVRTLAHALGRSIPSVTELVEKGCQQRILRRAQDGTLRFAHDRLRGAALELIGPTEQSRVHLQLARSLQGDRAAGGEQPCELARHYISAGELAPARETYEAAMDAAAFYFSQCDDVQVLRVLEQARKAGERAGIPLTKDFYLQFAEAQLRMGDRHGCRDNLQTALRLATSARSRVALLARLAEVHNTDSDDRASLEVLAQAFDVLGLPMPSNDALKCVANTASFALHSALHRRHRITDPEDAELLCRLYLLTWRLARENGEPARALASTLEVARTLSAVPAGAVRVRAHSVYGGMLALVGLRSAAKRQHQMAREITRQLADPTVEAMYLRSQFVWAATEERHDEALQLARHYDAELGHWDELDAYCAVMYSVYLTETAFGRPRNALTALERMLTHAANYAYAPMVLAQAEDLLSATLIALGRDSDIATYSKRVARLRPGRIVPGGFAYALLLQARVQRRAEAGDGGMEFDRLVAEYRNAKLDAAHAHPALLLFNQYVAYTLVHRCLRATPRERASLLPALEQAVRDCEKPRRSRMAGCTARVLRAHVHWFRGKDKAALRALQEGEECARELRCIVAMLAAGRLRAHMLRAAGNLGAAREHAISTADLARRHGHMRRARWILEDMGLEAEPPQPKVPARIGAGEPPQGIQHHLNALLNISRAASWELGPDRQARLVLREITLSFGADRGLLFLRDDDTEALELSFTCAADGAELDDADMEYDEQTVGHAYATGELAATNWLRLPPKADLPREEHAVCAPLVLRGEVFGAVYLGRMAPRSPFVEQECDLLQALATQVPITLELARSLHERQQLEQHLLQAQKMEAIGRLAGGIAHDFNNILATIQIAGASLVEALPGESPEREAVDDILDVAERGGGLTKQLLTFARRRPAPPRALDLNDTIEGVLPMLTRLVGNRVTIETVMDPNLPRVMADTTRVEQVVVNLVTNARDALRDGGMITIRTQTELFASDAAVPGGLTPGLYARLTVSDNGQGMPDHVVNKIFDPFFTTKGTQQGTGLGLSTVYGIVTESQGQISVRTELGKGTSIDTWLPTITVEDQDGEAQAVIEDTKLSAVQASEATLLVVDDDPFLCRATQRVLNSQGYRTITASDPGEARARLMGAEPPVDMLITDVHLARTDGRALFEELQQLRPGLRVLFISGDPFHSLVDDGLLDPNLPFMRKPFAAPAFGNRVRALLSEQPPPPPAPVRTSPGPKNLPEPSPDVPR